jgi:hypothetical protein
MFATPLAGLVWTARQSGRAAYLDLARRYADVMLRHREPARMTFASKSGWAALELHAHRPDADLLAYATAVGCRMLELLLPSGAIDSSNFPGLEREVPPAIVLGNTWDWALTALALGNGAS